MKKSTLWKQVGDFIVGKGFYIVLFLCVATIGISGYYLVTVFNDPGTVPVQPVTGDVQVTIPDDDAINPLPDPDREVSVPPVTQPVTPPAEQQPEQPPAVQDKQPEQTAQTPSDSTGGKTQETQPKRTATAPVYTWPVKGEVISGFSLQVLAYDETMGDWRTHSGVDIAAAVGTRVLAMSNGTVSRVYQDDLMGTTVVIDHEKGLQSRYHNLNAKPTVNEGDVVVTGTVIGAVGETALAEVARPSHLHLEVFLNGTAVDPVDYLPNY